MNDAALYVAELLSSPKYCTATSYCCAMRWLLETWSRGVMRCPSIVEHVGYAVNRRLDGPHAHDAGDVTFLHKFTTSTHLENKGWSWNGINKPRAVVARGNDALLITAWR